MAEYQAELLHQADYKTAEWSGGATTELSIAPENSIYADRDFEWRLSSATVEVEESVFTSLPDYNRIIMTLQGGIRLTHNQGEWIELPEFTPHAFDGGDKTVSIGKVIDFNLMMRKGVCTGDVVPMCVKAGDSGRIDKMLSEQVQNYKVIMVYCYEGILLISLENGDKYEVRKGDVLKLTGTFEHVSWSYKADTKVSAVLSAVHYC